MEVYGDRNLVDDDWLYVGMIPPQKQSTNSGNPITLILNTP